jgi:hypothetical protein
MNKEDIIRMARQSGMAGFDGTVHAMFQLEAFAALVAAAEREACAKVCENGVDTEHPTVKGHIMKMFGASSHLAAAIRARGNT